MRVVLDANVLVSGLMLPESVPGKIVAAWRAGKYDLVVSEPLVAEIARVLAYPKIVRRLGWDAPKIDWFVSLLRFETVVADIGGTSVKVPRDSDDSAVLATLVAGNADCLITEDLLSLAGDYAILSPAEFAARLF